MKIRLFTMLLAMLISSVIGPFAWAGTKFQLTTDPATDLGPHFNSDGSQIVFFSNRSGYADIYKVNSDGSNLVQLTMHAEKDFQPHFSPDGSRIAFKSNRSGDTNIWLMNSDGSNLTQLTFDSNGLDPESPPSYGPDWSPDGSKIVFDTMRSGNHDIWIMNADGSNPVQLTNEPAEDAHPDFSSDGNRIVFWSSRSGFKEIWSMNADGSNQTQLTFFFDNSVGHPHFNHDGTKISFWHMGNIWEMNADGSSLIRFPYDSNAGGGHDWSPDGSKVAYMSGESGNTDIWLFEIGDMLDTAAISSTVTQLTYDIETDAAPSLSPDGSRVVFSSLRTGSYEIWAMDANGHNSVQLTSGNNHVGQPHWSPDGSKIVYRSAVSGLPNIWTMNADGSGKNQLSGDLGPEMYKPRHGQDWSPDGTEIVFDSQQSGNYDIWRMDATGGNQVQLTSDPEEELHPAYSPDGTKIVYVKRGPFGVFSLWLMNADGSGQTQLTFNSTHEVYHPHFSPDGSKIIFRSDFLGNGEVTILQLDNLKTYTISNNPADDGGGQFSADGTKVLFRSSRGGNHDVWMHDFESSYVANLKSLAKECPPWSSETVDIIQSEGQTVTSAATGLIVDTHVVAIDRRVDVLTGSHSGWRFARGTYSLGNYSGSLYKVTDDNGQGWAVAVGDIHATIRDDGSGNRIWYVTSINGKQVDGQIHLALSGSTTATSSIPMTLTQVVRTGFKWSGQSTGFYEGPLENNITSVRFPDLGDEHGFSYGTYVTDIGTGSGRSYFDDRDPLTNKRYIASDGVLFGHGIREWAKGSYACYDLASTQRSEYILTPGLPVDSSYQSSSDNLFLSNTGIVFEDVDVTVLTNGLSVDSASGAMNGTRTIHTRKKVLINSGSYAGWRYRVGTYELNGYRGTVYNVSNGVQGWGLATGDIRAVIKVEDQSSGTGKWHITSVKGVPATGVIDFTTIDRSPGTATELFGLKARIGSGTHEVTYSGYFTGTNDVTRTSVILPSLGDGFVLVNYVSPWGAGKAYLYADNSHAPLWIRKGMADGPMFGTRESHWEGPVEFGVTSSKGLWEFISTDTDSDGWIDSIDNCQNVANADQADYDTDGVGDVCDVDDDNDGLNDSIENAYGLNPLDSTDASADLDGDGLSNYDEIVYGGNIAVADADGDGVSDSADNCPSVPNPNQGDDCSGTPSTDGVLATPLSTPVTVAPLPETEITFEEVTSGGTVTVTRLSNPAPPANFKIVTGTAYEILTDATFAGRITVCLDYQDSALSNAGKEDNLKLFHRGEAGWEDITTTIDVANNQICGETMTFSPFAVAEPKVTESTSQSSGGTGVPIMNGWWLLAAVGGGLSLLRRRRN